MMMDIGGASNVIFIVFSPLTFLYTIILSAFAGVGFMI
jgi:hypothetical protein